MGIILTDQRMVEEQCKRLERHYKRIEPGEWSMFARARARGCRPSDRVHRAPVRVHCQRWPG